MIPPLTQVAEQRYVVKIRVELVQPPIHQISSEAIGVEGIEIIASMPVAVGSMNHEIVEQLVLNTPISIDDQRILQIRDDGAQARTGPIESSNRVDRRNLQVRVGRKVARAHRSQSVNGWNAAVR